MKSCCLTCEHCEAIDRHGDLVLCCMLEGEENPKEVDRNHVCKDFNASIFADFLLYDATNQTEIHHEPKLKSIPEFLKAR